MVVSGLGEPARRSRHTLTVLARLLEGAMARVQPTDGIG
jgi:hypothetical protein